MKYIRTILVSLTLGLLSATAFADTHLWITSNGSGIEISDHGRHSSPPPPGMNPIPPHHHHNPHDGHVCKVCKKYYKDLQKAKNKYYKEMHKAQKHHKKHYKKHHHK
ncbi:MAG: hypothetical protein K2K29_03370 [Muribaculaceae bacterium]|nr:hypothetical protein [Muribaculaceae bacterium]